MRAFDLAIFDVDNTLWDNAGAHEAAARAGVTRLVELTGRDEADVVAGFVALRQSHATAPLEALFAAHPLADDEARQAAVACYGQALLAAMRPFPGAGALLERLRRHGVRVAFFSENPAPALLKILDRTGLGPLADAVYCPARHRLRDHWGDGAMRLAPRRHRARYEPGLHLFNMQGPKASARALRLILRNEGVSPRRAFMLGDNDGRDIEPARMIGMPAFLAGWGRQGPKALEGMMARIVPYSPQWLVAQPMHPRWRPTAIVEGGPLALLPHLRRAHAPL